MAVNGKVLKNRQEDGPEGLLKNSACQPVSLPLVPVCYLPSSGFLSFRTLSTTGGCE